MVAAAHLDSADPAGPHRRPEADVPAFGLDREALRRVGRPDIRIPLQAITFDPPILGPGRDVIPDLLLTDDRFTGANYTGTLRLRRSDGAGRDSETVTFTVGL